MLADTPTNSTLGVLQGDIHKPHAFLHELIEFISHELSVWKARSDRRLETAETIMTSQLCAHLNSASRHANGWDILQFRPEETDELKRGRKLDLAAAPSGTAITVDGRRYIDFDTLLPVECKRLPIPADKNRDAREYVFCEHSSRGGIQRFKEGHHGSTHKLGAMIAYVQADDPTDWHGRINGWIDELVGSVSGWTEKDRLTLDAKSDNQQGKLRSVHSRVGGLSDIELRHMWIRMS
jgi:hypothetical protein